MLEPINAAGSSINSELFSSSNKTCMNLPRTREFVAKDFGAIFIPEERREIERRRETDGRAEMKKELRVHIERNMRRTRYR